MNQAFNDTSATLWRVFKAYFAKKYSLSPKPRRSAWESMRNYIAHKARYRRSRTEITSARLKAKVIRTASLIGIRLKPKLHQAFSTSISRRRRRLPSLGLDSTSAREIDWHSSDNETFGGQYAEAAAHRPQIELTTPHTQRAIFSGGLLTPPSTQKKGVSSDEYTEVVRVPPPIAFRGESFKIVEFGALDNGRLAFSESSQGRNGVDGFVAGSFVDVTNIPDVASGSIYLEELERHLARQHTGCTPFVSVSQNILRVIHHALRRNRDSNNGDVGKWKVGVIILSKVPGSVRAVWDLDAGEHSRKAFGEWVVWGSITSSNVLSVLSMDQLLGLMSQTIQTFHVDIIQAAKWTGEVRRAIATSVNRGLTHRDGVNVGRLLQFLGIPKRHLDYATHNILADWRYPEHRQRAWELNQEFVRGRIEAYQRITSDFLTMPDGEEEDQEPGCHAGTLMDTHSRNSAPQSAEVIHTSNFDAIDARQDPRDINVSFMDLLEEIKEAASGQWNPQPGQPLPRGGLIEVVNDDPRTGFVMLEKGAPGPWQPGMALSGRYCVKEVNDDANAGFIWLKQKSRV
ncbi:MAG: hypothetical protein Q9181_002184 [Wetmoreana brouardii]